MKSLVIAFGGILLWTVAASAESVKPFVAALPLPSTLTAKHQKAIKEERAFLRGLGFEDYSMEANATLQKIAANATISPVVKPVLEANAIRALPVSEAREAGVLARVALERAAELHQFEAAVEKLLTLTTYHLLPFPLMGLDPIPESVFQFKMGPEALKLRTDYIQQRSQRRYDIEKKSFVATFLELLFSERELVANPQLVQETTAGLDKMATEIFKLEYSVSALQQSRYLGRALAATLVRYARSHRMPEIESRLRRMLAEQGVDLENHISSQLTFRDRFGGVHQVKVVSGDIANEYSGGAEAYQISAGVLPAPENRTEAARLKLIGSLALVGTGLTDKLVESATRKRRSNEPLNDSEARVLDEIWNSKLIHGFSHAGLAEVRRDVASGIEMVWIWDVYPIANLGGMRFQTPENFTYAEHHNRIGFVHYNPAKAFAVFKRQIEQRGYLENVWESSAAVLTKDQDNEPDFAMNSSKKVARQSFVDEKTVRKWSQWTTSEGAQWFTTEAVPRALRMARNYFTGQEALLFASEFKNIDHSAYCSQMILFAFLQGANFDMQAYPDDWRGVSKLAGKFTSKLPIQDRIVAASGFAWQKDLTESVQIIDLDRTPYLAQVGNAPFLNGRPTVIDQRLSLLSPLLNTKAAQILPAGALSPLDPNSVDDTDDDL